MNRKPHNYINWTGKEIGPFLVIKKIGKKPSGRLIWEVKCNNCNRTSQIMIDKSVAKHRFCFHCFPKHNSKTNHWRWKGVGSFSSTQFHKIKQGAIQRGIEFFITFEYAWDVFVSQNGKCALSGVPISFPDKTTKTNLSKGSASLDRIDSKKGYIEGNVQWVHKDINIMKNDLSERQFVSYCQNVSNCGPTKSFPKILITGGAGYIGNILVSVLLNKGYRVTVLDNLIHRQHAILENCSNKNFEFVYGDVRDQPQYKKLISANDVIVNLAAYVGAPLCARFPREANEVNFGSAKFLSENASQNQRVIFTCTNSGYGLGRHADGKAIYCTETTPLTPISLYGSSKVNAEAVLMSRGNCTSLRLATVMGVSRKMRMDLLVNDFTYRAWNDKFIVLFESQFLRNFVHIKDVANAIHKVIETPQMIGQVYNCGNTSANVNKMDLCLAIKKYVPDFFITESPINKDPDQRNYIVSNEKLEALGWKPQYSLDDAIVEVLKACPIIKNTNCPFSDI